LTSHDKKKIIDIKKINPFQDGRLSSALYMMNTQPSWDAATYTVKKLVANNNNNNNNNRQKCNIISDYHQTRHPTARDSRPLHQHHPINSKCHLQHARGQPEVWAVARTTTGEVGLREGT